MGAVEELATEQSDAPDPIEAAERAGAILGLEGEKIVGARLVGDVGGSCDWHFSNGETITFEKSRDMAKPMEWRTRLALQLQLRPKLSTDQCVELMALASIIAEREEAMSEDEIAFAWGSDFLQVAPVIDVDMSDRRERWGAFSHLEGVDPVSMRATGEAVSIAAGSPVLRDVSGTRFVRTGWFRAHVRAEESISSTEVANRMRRVGWTRRGKTGRVKATRPDFPDQTLAWSFYTVPEGWEAS